MWISEIQEKTDRELIAMCRDAELPLSYSDMHGLALVLARRLEKCRADRQLLVDAINGPADREHAKAAPGWAMHSVDMEVP